LKMCISQVTQKKNRFHCGWITVSEHDSVWPLKGNLSTLQQLFGRLHCGCKTCIPP